VTFEIVFVLVAAFGAGFVDAMAGGGGLIQLPALFAAFPQAPHTTLLGTGKLAGLAGTTSAIFRFIRHVRLDWSLVLSAAAGAFLAALVGAWIATRFSPAQFRALVPVPGPKKPSYRPISPAPAAFSSSCSCASSVSISCTPRPRRKS